jgi:Flavin containing amine oxidoreductase
VAVPGTDELDQLSRSRHSRCGISWPGLRSAPRPRRDGRPDSAGRADEAADDFLAYRAEPPTRQRLLHLDADLRGPVVNTAVMTTVAPTYAPAGRCLIATTTLGADGSAEAERAARRHAGQIYGADPGAWELVTTHVIKDALPVQEPPLQVRQPVALSDRLFVAGDHRDTASIQGALVSGRRAATAVLVQLATSSADSSG